MASKRKSSKDPHETKLATAKEEKDQSILILHAFKDGKKIDELLFSRESSNHPPSLTTPTGDMFHGTYADLMHCILEHVQIQKKAPDSQTEIVVDLSFLMQSFKPGTSTTIGEFIHVIIITYVRAHLQKYKIVDLVCDVYLGKSLKAPLRDIRCQGERKGVRLYKKLPRNFQSFL